MHKSILATVVIVGSIFTNSLFAADLFHKLNPKLFPVTRSSENLPAPHNGGNYTNFSGHWVGKCSVGEGHEERMTLTITNDDTHFNMDGEELNIGKLYTHSDSNTISSSFEHTSVEWSSDMSKLIIKKSYYDKIHPAYPYNNAHQMRTYISKMVLSLEDEDLIMKGHSILFMDLEEQGLDQKSCVLRKK